eukprot:18011-Heterococcus_DN1.PRE.2
MLQCAHFTQQQYELYRISKAIAQVCVTAERTIRPPQLTESAQAVQHQARVLKRENALYNLIY